MKCFKKRKPNSNSNSKPDQGNGGNISDSKLRFFYPNALWLPEEKLLKTRWTLPKIGKKLDWDNIVILTHHTAGWQNRTGQDFIKSFNERGLCTDFLDESGQVWQQRHGDRVGSNAGKSKFKGKGNVSKFAIAIEIAAGGKLKLKKENGKLISWSEKEIPENCKMATYFNKIIPNARYVDESMGYEVKGWFEPFTEAQEESLAKWYAYWIKMGARPENIVGHDEVAGKKYLGIQRKNDPGGSLSLPLGEFVKKRVIPLV